MATVVMDRSLAEHLRQERQASGADRWDEVWEGTYMMAPLPNNEHQQLATRLANICEDTVGWEAGAIVFQGTNVSDREKGWKHNYRCPDVAVYLPGTQAKDCNTHWFGGPDFAVEIVSPDDMTRDKLAFYAKVGVRELLIVDRDPWILELLRLRGKKLVSEGHSSTRKKNARPIISMPLTFRLVPGKQRPSIKVLRTTDGKVWKV
jgi:Uma2 family endonuclease